MAPVFVMRPRSHFKFQFRPTDPWRKPTNVVGEGGHFHGGLSPAKVAEQRPPLARPDDWSTRILAQPFPDGSRIWRANLINMSKLDDCFVCSLFPGSLEFDLYGPENRSQLCAEIDYKPSGSNQHRRSRTR